MFTQCPECKTIFGFNEEHTQVAGGQVRCSQCSHVFDAMAHSMDELPNADNNQPAAEATPAPAPELNEVVEEPAVAEAVEETTTDSDDDDAFSLFDDANDFMEAISDDFHRPESSSEENIVFNELGDAKAPTETSPEPVVEETTEQEPADAIPEPDKSTIEAAMEEEAAVSANSEAEEEEATTTETSEEEPTEPVAETTAEEDEADNLADEWASMLDEEENTETTSAESVAEEEATAETPEPAEAEEEATAETPEPAEAEEETTAETPEPAEAEEEATAETPEPAEAKEEATAEPSEEVTLSESTDEEDEGLDENSSLQDFLQSHLEDLDDAPAEAEALDISIDHLAEQPVEKQPVEQATAQPEDEETSPSLIEDIIPSEDNASQWGITLAWVMGILTSLILLTGQYIYTIRDDLSQIPTTRPWVVKFCEMTECTVPLYSNLEQLEFISQDVRSHPRYQNALMVTIVFINKSPFHQAYPVIQFQLSDIDQNPAAGRYFLPDAYLDASADIEEGIKPDTPIRAVIEINDPGERAINYDFDFR